MSKRTLLLVPVLAIAFGGGARIAGAHECTYDGDKPDEGKQTECHETPVKPNWRDGNYVPLFDLKDRDEESQRREAQRWRDECEGYHADGTYENNQFCIWLEFGNSGFPGPGGDGPNEVHAGSGGQHCFLFEFAHQCEHHDKRHGEGVHDAHGGATYVDICLTENSENRYCDEGMEESQVGVTIMDHNPCGTIVPVVACTDEYHVIRPFDAAYTQEQITDSVAYTQRIASDPVLYLCGYANRRGGGNPICPRGVGGGGSSVLTSRGVDVGWALGPIPRASEAGMRAWISAIEGQRLLAAKLPASRSQSSATALGAILLAVVAVALRARRFVTAH